VAEYKLYKGGTLPNIRLQQSKSRPPVRAANYLLTPTFHLKSPTIKRPDIRQHASYTSRPPHNHRTPYYNTHYTFHRTPQPENSHPRPQDTRDNYAKGSSNHHNYYNNSHYSDNPRYHRPPPHRCTSAPPQAPRDHGRQGVWRADEASRNLDQQARCQGMFNQLNVLIELETNVVI
jgi:hypothetical protein